MDSTQLYRHWDESGTLLYVGISYSSLKRLRQHEKTARWFKLVKSVTIEQFSNRKEAEIAEMVAIKSEKPLYNIVGVETTAVAGEKPFKWSKPKYKIVGKVLLNAKYLPTYYKILSDLELGKIIYTGVYSKESVNELMTILKLSSPRILVNNRVQRSASGFCIIQSTKSNITNDYITEIGIHNNLISLLITARDNNDPHLLNEYFIEEKEDTRYPIRQVYPDWYFIDKGLTGETNE